MAELVLCYDNVTGRFISRTLISDHLADAAVINRVLASGVVGSGKVANAAIVSAMLGSGQVGAAHFSSGDQWPARIFSGRIALVGDWTGNLVFGSGTVFRHATFTRDFLDLHLNFDPVTGLNIISGKDLTMQFNNETEQIRFGEYPPAPAGSGGVGYTITLDIFSGNLTPGARVDGVDISAHTHTGGAGDAGQVLSAGLGSGQVGPHIAAGGVLSAHVASAQIAGFHIRSGEIFRGLSLGTPVNIAIGLGIPALVHSGKGQIGFTGGSDAGSTGTTELWANVGLIGTTRVHAVSGMPVYHFLQRPDYQIQRFEEYAATFPNSGLGATTIQMDVQSGQLTNLTRVDGVDVSAHTHAGGAGDAGQVLSAGLGSGQAGPMHFFLGAQPWGTVAFYNPSSGWRAVAPGNSGQRLTTWGSGADPAWAA